MEKIFNWGTTVPRETLIEKINELSNIVLDNTTKGNKLFTEIDKSSFYTKRFPDLFKLTVFNKDGKVYNPDDKEDMVFKINIKELDLKILEEKDTEYCLGFKTGYDFNGDIDNRVVNAYIVSRNIINIVNHCSAKYKFFQLRECDLYNACYALVEFVLYLRLMDISPERQFSTLIYCIDDIDKDSIQIFYTLAHRLGIPLYSGYSDIFLEQLHYTYYRVQQDSSGYCSAKKVHDNIIRFELVDEYSAPSNKYFMLGDEKISLTLDISSNTTLFKKDLDCLLDNDGLQCFKFTNDTRELYKEIGKYSITVEYNSEYKNYAEHSFIHVFDSSLSEYNVHGISKGLLVSEPLGYLYNTIVEGLLPRTIFKVNDWKGKIMVLPMLEIEFRRMVENVLK